jgi:5-methylcytosine-specific restriction endonuclease McrA
MRSKLKVKLKDSKRLFDVLEREVVWWRDDKKCKLCGCHIPFQEATVHHVTEHTAGGPTQLTNAVLICQKCAPKRKDLQAAETELKDYLRRLQAKRGDG